ncbi:hypothetical protein B0H15DRAFT_953123 [Mycena belliarum]|uniref:Uncharacterized protein n=1 Tax=Mycena belliarum TaxID=1033014 RepID=A0AAD6U1F5_9AGAR|nr:hypothetical protein B0H15DRAFT_953123 [Mycena belliae]
MPPVLSALSYLLDFKLGPENVTSDMVFKNAYVDARTAEPLSVLVVGTVAATVDLSGGVYMIVLETPPLSSPVLRAMFEEQTQVLDNVLIADRLDMARVNELVPTSLHNVIPSQLVIHRQHWSQGPSDSSAGVVYVTVTRDTRFTRNDFSVERAMFPFVGVAREVPVGDPESAMEPGALMQKAQAFTLA